MTHHLNGKTIAFLATNGVEQSELVQPWEAVENAGGKPVLVSLESGEIQAFEHDKKAERFQVDQTVAQAQADEFNGLVLPGGVSNPDQLRQNEEAVEFVRCFFEQHKPVAAICHGPWMLVEADVLENRRLTSYPSLRTDIANAGGNWVDEEVVVDEGLVTSRTPEDLEAFCRKAVEEFAEGKHPEQVAAA